MYRKIFLLLSVSRPALEAHLASCSMGTGGPFPGVKSGRGVTLTTPFHLVPRSRKSRIYTLPLGACMAIAGLLYFTQGVARCASGTPASICWSLPLSAQEWMQASCLLFRSVQIQLLKLLDIILFIVVRYTTLLMPKLRYIFSACSYVGFIWNISHVPPHEALGTPWGPCTTDSEPPL
jgi:hypothetical protein